MRVASLTMWVVLFLGISQLFMGCASTKQVSEKAQRRSERFYEAASISWFQEHNTLAAIRSLTRAVEINPDNDHACYLLGIIRFSRGEYEDAEKYLRKTVELRKTKNDAPGLAGARNNLGLLLIHLKKYQEAADMLKASAEEVMNHEPWLAMGNLGWAHIELGEYDLAISWLRRAMFDQPKYCVGMFRMGQAYYMKKEYTKAEVLLKQALEIPEQGCDQIQDAYYFLGMAYLRLGKDHQAKRTFGKCVNISQISDNGILCAEVLAGL
ncbi:MAG: tetratricopeptide repeat protein [Proteobacteria bacterium]|nr:tetratricopeptide repeat protein [Pseudomonadota bacterium]